ncbi:syndecan-3 [Camelus ferus]|nr:syndecan-3 [Camelus ferus]
MEEMVVMAQRWRSENFERPVDLEGSGDDDSFPDDELDDLYSGSGSGYFEQESGIETAMRFSPDVALAVSTTPAVLPTMDIQPVGTPFEELPSERPTPEPATSSPLDHRRTEAFASSTDHSSYRPGHHPSSALTSHHSGCLGHRDPNTQAESSLTTTRDEPEVSVSGGPSGDFELPEEETTQPDTANEVVAVGGAAAKPSPPPGTLPKGARPGPGLLDNAIDSGSSAAQLPQKSILERKEVLVAVIVGGVVGALFAAFLVTLLIYRMKKKDEGSYTLEEPKQASVTYQKPDKQEEFYA